MKAHQTRPVQWTAGHVPPISIVMANRLFLTLLALLTGLAAQIAPAQARVCGQETSAVAVSAPLSVRAATAPAALAQLPEAGWRHARLVASQGQPCAILQWRAPSVRIQIDRAHE